MDNIHCIRYLIVQFEGIGHISLPAEGVDEDVVAVVIWCNSMKLHVTPQHLNRLVRLAEDSDMKAVLQFLWNCGNSPCAVIAKQEIS